MSEELTKATPKPESPRKTKANLPDDQAGRAEHSRDGEGGQEEALGHNKQGETQGCGGAPDGTSQGNDSDDPVDEIPLSEQLEDQLRELETETQRLLRDIGKLRVQMVQRQEIMQRDLQQLGGREQQLLETFEGLQNQKRAILYKECLRSGVGDEDLQRFYYEEDLEGGVIRRREINDNANPSS